MNDGTFAAVDLGASSRRVMVARVGAGSLELTEAHRFANRPVRTGGRFPLAVGPGDPFCAEVTQQRRILIYGSLVA